MEDDPGTPQVKRVYRWDTRQALLLMYFGGGTVWWLLSTALPWVGVPPLCITFLWFLSYYAAHRTAKKFAAWLDHWRILDGKR